MSISLRSGASDAGIQYNAVDAITLTGTTLNFAVIPTAPTATANTNSTALATTAFVGTAVTNGVSTAISNAISRGTMTNTAAQTLALNTLTKITLNTAVNCVGITGDTTNSRLTVTSAGNYIAMINFVGTGNAAATTINFTVYKNGIAVSGASSSTASAAGVSYGITGSISVSMPAVIGDYFEVYVYQDSGSTLTFGNDANACWLNIETVY